MAFSGQNVNNISPNQIKMMASRSETSTGLVSVLQRLMYVQMLMEQIVRHPEIAEINLFVSFHHLPDK